MSIVIDTKSSAELLYVRHLLKERSALVLNVAKDYLLEARLTPLAKTEGYDSYAHLLRALMTLPYGALHRKVVEAMTTNETTFFRDIHPFDALRTSIIPELLLRRSSERKLNIYCGASSSGQEPYSIAMLLHEHFPELATWNVSFLATDLSEKMLERCREGKYSQLEVNRGLPPHLLDKYFTRHGLDWVLADVIRNMVTFKQLNLAAAWPPLPKMDLIFLRNVMIYFQVDTKKEVFERIYRVLRPDGYLFLGCAESTMSLDNRYEQFQVGKTFCYRPCTAKLEAAK